METNFQKEYSFNILSKLDFQDSEVTNDFVTWLIPFIQGGTKNLKQLGLDYDGKYESLNDAIEKYNWKDLDFKTTFRMFEKWRGEIKETTDEVKLERICLDILKWGGVEAYNSKKISQRIGDLKSFLTQIRDQTRLERIIIDDLNPNHISSGFTKIYAAQDKKFIIYDGRVGAALCYLVRCYLESKGKTKIPSELLFSWGEGQTNSKQRNPNSRYIKFPNFQQRQNIHFVSNIKANWLLSLIAKSSDVDIAQSTKHAERVFALQTALFVLGQKLPLRVG